MVTKYASPSNILRQQVMINTFITGLISTSLNQITNLSKIVPVKLAYSLTWEPSSSSDEGFAENQTKQSLPLRITFNSSMGNSIHYKRPVEENSFVMKDV